MLGALGYNTPVDQQFLRGNTAMRDQFTVVGIDGFAIQGCINAAIRAGRKKVFVPYRRTGYRVSTTIIVQAVDGFEIEFESNTLMESGAAQLRWIGGAAPVLQFSGPNVAGQNIAYGVSFKNISIDGDVGGTRATCGIAFGELGVAYNQLIKFCKSENVSIKDCRIGTWLGRNLAQDNDIASHTHVNWYITNCTDHGILVATGNAAAITFQGGGLIGNGYSPTNDATNGATGRGTNACLVSGSLSLLGGHSTGTGASQPTTADVYMNANSLTISDWWSDTNGPFLKQSGTWQRITLTAVRHYSADMTDVNTPTSIDVTARIVLSDCYLFGDVKCTSGNGGSILSMGTQFHSGAPRSVTGTFKGDIVTAYYGLKQLNEVGNTAQDLSGGGARALAQVGAMTPADVLLGNATIRQWLSDSASDSGHTLFATAADGSANYLVNAYFYDVSANVRAHKIGMAYRVIVGSTDRLRIYGYNFADTTTSVALSAFTELTGVSADKGDAIATLTVGLTEQTVRWNTPLTADRAVTLSTTNAVNGSTFRIVRTAAATGAFNLNVGALKALALGTWCEIQYNGAAWMLTGYGAL